MQIVQITKDNKTAPLLEQKDGGLKPIQFPDKESAERFCRGFNALAESDPKWKGCTASIK